MKTRMVQLGEIAEIGAGQGAPQDPTAFSREGHAFIRASSLDTLCNSGNHSSLERLSPHMASKHRMRLFPANTVVFAKSGMSATKNRVYRLSEPCYVVNHLATVQPNTELDPTFLRYWLEKLDPTTLIQDTAYPSISQEDVGEVGIPLPSLPEQRRVAAKLLKVDRLRRLRRYALELTDSFIPAVFLKMFGDPIQNTKGWPVVTVEESGRVQLGRQRAPKYQTGRFRKPYIRVANVYENEIDLHDLLSMDFDDSDFAAYKLEYGDILLNEGQSTELVGRPAMWRDEIPDCCFQNTLIRFHCAPKVCHPAYALWLFIKYLHSGEFAKISAKTSSVAHLGAFRLAQMRFPVPPLSLQQDFGAIVERAESLRNDQRESLRQAEHLFQSLLAKAFMGDL